MSRWTRFRNRMELRPAGGKSGFQQRAYDQFNSLTPEQQQEARTNARRFRQSGVRSIGSFALGGIVGGGAGAAAGAVAGATPDDTTVAPPPSEPLSAPPVDTSLPLTEAGSPSTGFGGGDPTGLGDPFGGAYDPAAFATDAGAPTGFGDPYGGTFDPGVSPVG